MFKWLVLGYLLLVAKELYFMSGPPVCTALSRHCIPSLIPPFWTLSVDLSVQSSKYEYDPLPDCSFIVSFSNFTTLSPSYDHTCYLNLTAFHRRRTPERDLDPPTPIMANLDISYMNTLVKTIKVELSDVRPVRVGGRRTSTEYRDLLSAPTDITPSITPSQDVDATSQDVDATEEPTSGTYLVPYWRFTSYSPLTIVYTAAHHQTPKPPTNVVRTGLPTKNSLFYSPDIYFSDIATLSSSAIEIGPDPTDRPPVKLTITFAALSFLPSTVLRQTGLALTTFETLLSDIDPTVGAGVFDEIRYMLSPRYLYRFVLSNIISTLHVYLSFMAFKNDVGFYKGKSDMKGISASSLITSFISSFIIFLYLMDSGGTSSVVLLTIGVEVLIDLWKLSKILRPKFTPTFPFVNIYDPGARSAGEVETMDYDAIATKNLWLTLLPILIGSAMYSLQFYKYKSWYSFAVSHASNMVYTLGFVRLCPQIYINYKFKSVSYLPWRVFVYKIFSTFVDDVFACLIDMPLKHRVMTLRDDVVFLVVLYQTFVYRVDKSRANEYGIAYEEEKMELEGGEEKAVEEEKEEPDDNVMEGSSMRSLFGEEDFDEDDTNIVHEWASAQGVTVQYHLSAFARGFGDALWNSSEDLAELLCDSAAREEKLGITPLGLQELAVVEFGAAAALPSLVCAKMGARCVVITDQFEENAFKALNATAERAREGGRGLCKVEVRAHSWGEGVETLVEAGAGKFGLCIASDCLYFPGGHEVLLQSAAACLESGGRFLVGYSLHGNVEEAQILSFFVKAVERGWTIDKEWKIEHERQKAATWSKVQNRGDVYVKVLKRG